jgi:diaminopimelate epimerase
MTELRLSKLHATGNDFLVHLELDAAEPELDATVVTALCDRHRGIGADGVITIGPGRDGADCSMTLVNADGGRAEMSGNGVRCLAWVAARAGLARDHELLVDTAAGRRRVGVERDLWGDVVAAEVEMGKVSFDPAQIPVEVASPFDLDAVVDGTTYHGDAAGVGNPHFVFLVDDPATVPVVAHGARIEHDIRFPRRTNVEFVAVTGMDRLAMRVWERGVGETQSCGTGACASAAVAHRRGLVGERVRVDVLGGSLDVTLGPNVGLGGPVVHVFDVVVPRESLLESLARPTG